MANFTLDSDLLVLEPMVFSLRFAHQLACSGTDGATDASGLTFSADAADFETAGVEAGHVISVTVAGVRRYWSVLERASATSLTLAAPGAVSQSSLAWAIYAFGPQHTRIHDEILERNGVNLEDEAETRTEDMIANLGAIRRVAAPGVLALIYRGQANNIQMNSDWWRKADYYEGLYRAGLEQLAIEWDVDESGTTDARSRGGRVGLGRS